MRRQWMVAGLFVLGAMLLAGCVDEVSSYFNGDVVAKYENRSEGNSKITFTIQEKGTYAFRFSVTPGEEGQGDTKSPESFKKTIEVVPREIVITQRNCLRHLRITIVRDGKSESHDF